MPRGFSCSSGLCSLHQFQVQNTQGSQTLAAKISTQFYGCLPLVCWDTGFLTQFWMSAYTGLLAICQAFTGNSNFLTLLMSFPNSPFLHCDGLVGSISLFQVPHTGREKLFCKAQFLDTCDYIQEILLHVSFFNQNIIASQCHVQQSASAVCTHTSPPTPALPAPPGQHRAPASHQPAVSHVAACF